MNVCWKALYTLGFPEFQKVLATSSSWSASSKWDAPFPPFAWAGSATRVMVPAIWVHLARNPVLWMASPAPEWSLIWKFRASPPNYKVSAEAKNWRRCCSGTHHTTTTTTTGFRNVGSRHHGKSRFDGFWASRGYPLDKLWIPSAPVGIKNVVMMDLDGLWATSHSGQDRPDQIRFTWIWPKHRTGAVTALWYLGPSRSESFHPRLNDVQRWDL